MKGNSPIPGSGMGLTFADYLIASVGAQHCAVVGIKQTLAVRAHGHAPSCHSTAREPGILVFVRDKTMCHSVDGCLRAVPYTQLLEQDRKLVLDGFL